jgi:hypothetical protein
MIRNNNMMDKAAIFEWNGPFRTYCRERGMDWCRFIPIRPRCRGLTNANVANPMGGSGMGGPKSKHC